MDASLIRAVASPRVWPENQWMPSSEGGEDNRVLLHLYTGPEPVVLDAGDPDRKQVLYEQVRGSR